MSKRIAIVKTGWSEAYRGEPVTGDFAFIEWRATGDRIEVEEGADSFIIRNGKIVAQSIHYKVKAKQK